MLKLNMKPIPNTKLAPVIRTDFSNQPVWEAICAELREPVDGFYANVEFIDDPAFADLSPEQLLDRIQKDINHLFMIVVDHTAISNPEHDLLVLDIYQEPVRAFRALPVEIQGIENNLSISNMDFEEFADYIDEDGVFRGFPIE